MPPRKKAAGRPKKKRQTGRGPRSHMVMMMPQHGAGFFGDLWDGIKSVGNFVKDNKLISKGLGMIGDPRAQTGSQIAGQLGFGKRRGRRNVLVM